MHVSGHFEVKTISPIRRSPRGIMAYKRVSIFLLLLATSLWLAFINGQPFFMADTTAYVRGADFAIVYFFGGRYATTWTQKRALEPPSAQASQQTREAEAVNSPIEKKVLAGRSIFYGALLYLGHVTSYFWLSICLQAIAFLYLVHTITTKCVRLPFSAFVFIALTLLLITPVSFFVSFLMPDLFASFLILSVLMLVSFWRDLSIRDRLFLSILALYSSIVHLSHLLLLFCLLLTASTIPFLRRSQKSTDGYHTKAILALAIIAIVACLCEFSFLYAVQFSFGVWPVRPPYVMARLIADGPGYEFLEQNCPSSGYTICHYLDRLPTQADTFLWSTNQMNGVFLASDQSTRVALSSEQPRFILDVLRFDPIGVIRSSIGNVVSQLFDIGLFEFFPTAAGLEEFKPKVPKHYFDGFLASPIIGNRWLEAPATTWFFSLYLFGFLSLILVGSFWPLVNLGANERTFFPQRWPMLFTLSISAMIFNAAICGALSGPHPRYQTRISWIPLLILLILVAKFWKHSRALPR